MKLKITKGTHKGLCALARRRGVSLRELLEKLAQDNRLPVEEPGADCGMLDQEEATKEALGILQGVDEELRALSSGENDSRPQSRDPSVTNCRNSLATRIPSDFPLQGCAASYPRIKGAILRSRSRTDKFVFLAALVMITGIFLGAQDGPESPEATPNLPKVPAERRGPSDPNLPNVGGGTELNVEVAQLPKLAAEAANVAKDGAAQVINKEELKPNVDEPLGLPNGKVLTPDIAPTPQEPAISFLDYEPSEPQPKPLKKRPVDPYGDEPKANYRLGAGDAISIKFHGRPEFNRPDITVAPDGTIGYLQASRFRVEGLTIPEVREQLEQKLLESHRDARLMVSPGTLCSKKFTILGMVKGNGIFKLTRRTRLLEALALSGGIVAPAAGVELGVDFRRSFLVRDGEKLNIDFERLYLQADLTDNVLIQDGDYIYLASNARNRCYALGAVKGARAVTVSPGMTLMAVITAAGGYTPEAWKGRVLLVRGSLSNPEVILVDSADILKGKAVDVQVQAGDLVYVHNRPFLRTTRMADTAIKAFIRGAVAGVTDDESSAGF